MGIYFIAAGDATDNRRMTLDRSWSIADIAPYLAERDVRRLQEHFPAGDSVFIWGANRQGQLPHVRTEEYVVDFNGQRVANVFRFCFFTSTGSDTRLQRHVGWDQGAISTAAKRAYPFVYFLKTPKHSPRDKPFILRAFDASHKRHFFDGQKYLDDRSCSEALERTGLSSVEELLGLSPGEQPRLSALPRLPEQEPSHPTTIPLAPLLEVPSWLRPVVDGVERLWNQEHSLERDHEHAVAQFLEVLGYRAGEEIRFQRANMDIVLAREGRVLAVIEVKADRTLASHHRNVITQAFGYALEAGAPFVFISNGNYYAVYDRRRGLSREGSLIAEFRLLALDQSALEAIKQLRRGVLE